MQMSLDYLSFVAIKAVKYREKKLFLLVSFWVCVCVPICIREKHVNRPYVGQNTEKELEKYFIKWSTNIFSVHFTDFR